MSQPVAGETEFGGVGGMIDPGRRAARVIGQEAGPLVQGVAEQLWEIYATDPSGLVGPTDPQESVIGEAPR